MMRNLPAEGLKLNVVLLFLVILYLRFFTEFFDRKFGVGISNIISGAFLILSILCLVKVRKFPSSILVLSLILFAIFCSSVVTSSISSLVDPRSAYIQSYKYLVYIFIPFAGYAVGASEYGARCFYRCIYYALVPSAIYAIVDGMLGGASIDAGVGAAGRAFGFGSHPVLFGVQLVLMLSLLLVISRSGLARGERSLTLLVYALVSFAILYTYAKTAWLFFAALLLLSNFKFSRSGFFVGAIVAVVLVVAFFLLRDNFSAFMTVFDFVSSGAYRLGNNYEYVDSSMHWRIIQWSNLFDVGKNNILLGVGPAQVVHYNQYNLSAHSSTLELFVEQGVLGFVFYIIFLGYILFLSFFKYKNNVIFKVNVVFYVLMSTFSISIFNQTLNMILVLLLVGFCAAPLVRVDCRVRYG